MTIQALYPDISPSLSLDFANVKQLDPRVTFARASTARYYDGKTVAKAEENLLLRSQEFDNASWVKGAVTVTADTTAAPDGTTTADTVTEDIATQNHQITQTGLAFTNAPTTVSVFVKANGATTGRILFRTGTAGAVSGNFAFDLSVPSASVTQGDSASVSITDAGNGWYRVVATSSNNAASTAVIIRITRLGESYTGDGTSGFFLWGAQLEQRSSVTAYTATTTQPITNYIPVLLSAANNEARFDHNPTTSESLGLLIEEQRTNLLLRSEEFDNASWTKTRSSITANTAVAPNGTLTGDKLVEDTTSSNTHIIEQGSITVVSGTTYSASVYIKAAERTKARVVYLSSASGVFAEFDFLAGTAGAATVFGTATAVSSSIQNVGNGWYRCTVVGSQSVGTSGSVRVELLDASGNRTYTGDGFSGLFIWGAQLEAGAFPTSYIPTVASQVTRSADAASMTGTNFSSWYRADEGTFFTNFRRYITNANANAFVASDNSFNNRISGFSFNGFAPDIAVGGVVQASIEVGSAPNAGLSGAVAYKVNDVAAAANGGAVGTDVSALVPVVNRLYIGANSLGTGAFLNGTIKKIAYYPKRLTNAQLQAITT
jgi:hypothetical protein